MKLGFVISSVKIWICNIVRQAIPWNLTVGVSVVLIRSGERTVIAEANAHEKVRTQILRFIAKQQSVGYAFKQLLK